MAHSCHVSGSGIPPHLTGFPSWNVLQIVPLQLWRLGQSPSSRIAGFSQALFWAGGLITDLQ